MSTLSSDPLLERSIHERIIGGMRRSKPFALGLVAAASLVLPAAGQAFADTPTAPTATQFMWQVQIPGGDSEAGLAPDLPTAIALAKLGEVLTPDQSAALVATLTQEATAAGVSLTTTAPAPAPVAPPIAQQQPADPGQ